MILTLIAAFVSLIGLLVLHEFGHFVAAKRFGVKVEEFGVGYPPKLLGVKAGETLFSLNLLPFGAFVRVPDSLASQPIWKRVLITIGGVFSFWVISTIIFGVVSSLGVPTAVEDQDQVLNPVIQIAAVSPGSPAQTAGLRAGDVIKGFGTVKEVQDLTRENTGREFSLAIGRGKEVLDIKLVPRPLPPAGQGPLGVSLVRTTLKFYPWYQLPWRGVWQTIDLTGAIVRGYYRVIHDIFEGRSPGVQLTGPVGVFSLLNQAGQLGLAYFLNFLGVISLYLAIFNLLPIPAVDGGKLLFLGIEAIRKKPMPAKIEQNVTTAFFMSLVALMIWVTIGDVRRLF